MLALELVSRKIEVSICTNKAQWYSYEATASKETTKTNTYTIKNCEWLPDAQAYKSLTKPLDGFEDLVSDCSGEFVISDNYLEPLLYTDFGLIFANFFWHRELGLRNPKWDELEQNVTERGTKFAGNIFAKPYASEKSSFEYFPLFGRRKRQALSRGYIILVLGHGSWVPGYEYIFSEYLEDITREYAGTCYVDPTISMEALVSLDGVDYELAAITEDLIAHAEAVVGRPSLGIVADCMCAGVPFFPIAMVDDLEAIHNKNIVTQLFSTPKESYEIKHRTRIRNRLADNRAQVDGERALSARIAELMIGVE